MALTKGSANWLKDTKTRRYTKRKPDGCAEPFVKLRALVTSWPFILSVVMFRSLFFYHEGIIKKRPPWIWYI
jgi:hypothetical protein